MRRLNGRKWSAEELRFLEGLWEEGFSAAQCARRLPGRSRSAVSGAARRAGLTQRNSPLASSTTSSERIAVDVDDLDLVKISKGEAGCSVIPEPIPNEYEERELDGVAGRWVRSPEDRTGRLGADETVFRSCQYPLWSSRSRMRSVLNRMVFGCVEARRELFCGANVSGRGPYCRKHHVRCFKSKSQSTLTDGVVPANHLKWRK
jgi:hypothetical protein